jgi:hypothetical protein
MIHRPWHGTYIPQTHITTTRRIAVFLYYSLTLFFLLITFSVFFFTVLFIIVSMWRDGVMHRRTLSGVKLGGGTGPSGIGTPPVGAASSRAKGAHMTRKADHDDSDEDEK